MPLGTQPNYLKRYVAHGDPDLIEHLNIIDEEISTADRIITDLMSMTRSKPPVREEVDFGEMVQEVLVRANLSEGIHSRVAHVPEPFTLDADPGQLRQVIHNLIANSVQALKGSGEIVIEGTREEARHEIVVRDNGPGVALEHRDQLFEPLFTTRAKGTGLGLTICREIVERHGGTIELVDDDKPGVAFSIRLPRQTLAELSQIRGGYAWRVTRKSKRPLRS